MSLLIIKGLREAHLSVVCLAVETFGAHDTFGFSSTTDLLTLTCVDGVPTIPPLEWGYWHQYVFRKERICYV